MKIAQKVSLVISAIFAASVPAMAGVTVNSPASIATVSSPFKLSATASTCSSSSVVTMGYSFDSSTNTTVFKSQSIDTSISATSGGHTLHVKAWAGNGIVCVKDVSINVSSSSTTSSSSPTDSIPSSADSVSNIEVLGGWSGKHDSGGAGSSSGYTKTVSSPSQYGSSREFVTSFSNNGTERYSVAFSDNTSAENFFYDGWVYFTSSVTKLANLELDINQTMPNGQTALIGVQCDGWTGNWAYNVNTGSASSPRPHWQSVSGTSCNPATWKQYSWHHVQFSLTRNNSGTVYYRSIWLDGKQTTLNKSAFVAADLGWGPVVNTQFQIDGRGNGTVTAYLDSLKISMW